MKYAIWAIVLILLSAYPVTAAPGPMPPELRQALSDPHEVRLYSLNPEFYAFRVPHQEFHEFPNLGSALLTPVQAQHLCSLVLRAIGKAKPPQPEHCFMPRHALRMGSVDLLICYQCGLVHCFTANGDWWAEMEDGGRPECERLVSECGLRTPGWTRVGQNWTNDQGIVVHANSLLQREDLFLLESSTLVLSRKLARRPEAPAPGLLGSPNLLLQFVGGPQRQVVEAILAMTVSNPLDEKSVSLSLTPAASLGDALELSESSESFWDRVYEFGEDEEKRLPHGLWHFNTATYKAGTNQQREVTRGYMTDGVHYVVVETALAASANHWEREALQEALDSLRFAQQH